MYEHISLVLFYDQIDIFHMAHILLQRNKHHLKNKFYDIF